MARSCRARSRPPYAVLKVFDPAVAAATIDLTKTYDDRFVKKANAGK